MVEQHRPANVRGAILACTFAVAVVGTIMLGAMANAQDAHPMPAQLCSMARELHIEKQCGLQNTSATMRNTSATITPPLSRPIEYRSNHGADLIIRLIGGIVLWWVIIPALFRYFRSSGVFSFAGSKIQGATQRAFEYAHERQREAERQQQADRQREETRREQETQRRRREDEQREAERQRQEERRQAERERQAENEREAGRRQREREHPSKQNWWEVLGVSPDASRSEIVRAYRSKIQQYHPDRVSGLGPELVELAEQRTKALNAAYAEAKRVRR
jgi:flagellar biosynthesis GTPase FlhF